VASNSLGYAGCLSMKGKHDGSENAELTDLMMLIALISLVFYPHSVGDCGRDNFLSYMHRVKWVPSAL